MGSVTKNAVVSIHYTLRDDGKEVLDSSNGEEPLVYLHGHGQIVPGLERALAGKPIGEKFQVSVSAEEGYGEYDANLRQSIPRANFPKEAEVEVGSMFEFSDGKDHFQIVRVVALEGSDVVVDGNHPLAGKALHFEVEVVSVRPATKEELKHGHAHGHGGCGH